MSSKTIVWKSNLSGSVALKQSFHALFCLILLFGINAQPSADQSDPRLERFFEQLQTSPDPESAHRVEGMIWAVWLSHDDAEIERLMAQGVNAMNRGDYAVAIERFSQIISLDADFAEGWNKRATAYYLQQNLAASMRDIQRTLALEPRHFGALSGLGLIFTASGDLPAAIAAYEDVLRIHPQSVGARTNLEQLQQSLQHNVI